MRNTSNQNNSTNEMTQNKYSSARTSKEVLMPHELSSSAITAKRLWVVHHHCTLNLYLLVCCNQANMLKETKRQHSRLVSPESLSITHLLSPAPPRGAAEESSLLEESSELLEEESSAAQNFDIVFVSWEESS